jgi:hypothetical protein
MLLAVEERQLIDQDGAQDEPSGGHQATPGELALAVEDALELAVEGLDRPRAEHVEDPSDLHSTVGMWIAAPPTGDQVTVVGGDAGAEVTIVGAAVGQQEAE